MIRAEDILKKREEAREAGLLAHTPNIDGGFWARGGCSCYNCRDELDPTGEIDAKMANEEALRVACDKAGIPMPPPAPKLTRQYAICVACQESHGCSDKCAADTEDSLSPQPTGCYLPPPPPLLRRQRCVSTGSSLVSPIGIISPSSSTGSTTIEEQMAKCEELEMRLCRFLFHLSKQYERLETLIQLENDSENLKHDEMAAYDAWWTEVDTKKAATEDLLRLLENDE